MNDQRVGYVVVERTREGAYDLDSIGLCEQRSIADLQVAEARAWDPSRIVFGEFAVAEVRLCEEPS